MKTTYKLNEFIATLKKWNKEGVKDICIDIDETGNEETQITAAQVP